MKALRRRLAAIAVGGLVAGGLVACSGTASAQSEFKSDARRLVPAIQLHEGQTVADIGAGGGQLAVELAREVGPSGRVYATELEEDRRRDIREAAKSAGVKNVEVIEARPTRTQGVPPMRSRVEKAKPLSFPFSRAWVVSTHASACLERIPIS